MQQIQSIPYLTYTIVQRDALTNVIVNYMITNSDTSTVQMWNGSVWLDLDASTPYVTSVAQMSMYNKNILIAIDTVNLYHGLFGFDNKFTSTTFTYVDGLSVVISSIAEHNAGVTYEVTTNAAHGLLAGDIITQSGFTGADIGYNGTKLIISVTANTYVVSGTYTSSKTGYLEMGAYILAGANASGTYNCGLVITGYAVSSDKTFKIEVNLNLTTPDTIIIQSRFKDSNDIRTGASSGILDIAPGDRLWISIKNITDTTDFRIVNANVSLHRI